MPDRSDSDSRLRLDQLETFTASYGSLTSPYGVLHSAHNRRFGWPSGEEGDAQRELERRMLFGSALKIQSINARKSALRNLIEQTGSEEVVELRDSQRRKHLGSEVVHLNELLEMAGLTYYVIGSGVHQSEKWKSPTTVTGSKGVVAQLSGFTLVDVVGHVDSHIEPIVLAKSSGQERGLLPESIVLNYAPLHTV